MPKGVEHSTVQYVCFSNVLKPQDFKNSLAHSRAKVILLNFVVGFEGCCIAGKADLPVDENVSFIRYLQGHAGILFRQENGNLFVLIDPFDGIKTFPR